jgi:hypothetical protein
VSRENVNLVLSLQPAPEADLTTMFRDDAAWTVLASALAEAFAPGVQIAAPDFFDFPDDFEGLDGLRAGWLQ